MNPKQRARKVRERAKTFNGIVSSLKNDEPLTRQQLNELLIRADELGLRIVAHAAMDAMEKEQAVRDKHRAEAIADHCQKEMSDMQAKIAQLENQLHGRKVARVRNMSKKAAALRPEKKGYRSAKWHPMSGYKNPHRSRNAR